MKLKTRAAVIAALLVTTSACAEKAEQQEQLAQAEQATQAQEAAASTAAVEADTSDITLDSQYARIKQKIENTIGLPVFTVADSPIDGMFQIATAQGLFYTSGDGKYLIHGRIFNVEAGMRNETEVTLAKMRKEGMKTFEHSAIEFKAENEKYVINVFTDIHCTYCRKLHREIENYNENGITVRYLAFPRSGLQSKTFAEMQSVWCSDNQQKAMTLAKDGKEVPNKTCANDVAQQYLFGQQVGVSGTPNIIMPDGSIVPGYMPADAMLEKLNGA